MQMPTCAATSTATNPTASLAVSETDALALVMPFLLIEDVARAPQCMDELALKGVVDLGTQAAHGNVDDVGIALEVDVPDLGGDVSPGQGLAAVLHQKREQGELVFGQVYPLLASAGTVPAQVQFQIRHLEHLRFVPGTAAQHRSHACYQLGEGERLDQVVVGAQLQTAHAVGHLVASGQEQHWRLLLPPQQLNDLPAVAARQHDIQDYQLVVTSGREVQSVDPGCGCIHDEPLFREALAQVLTGLDLILNHQQPHCLPPRRRGNFRAKGTRDTITKM